MAARRTEFGICFPWTYGSAAALLESRDRGTNIAISPDGQRIAFLERVEGGMDYGLYVADLDGSDRRLIAQLGHWDLSDPRWSPDGTWLSFGITNTDQYDSGTATAVINPATSEVFPLEGIEGYVQDWSR